MSKDVEEDFTYWNYRHINFVGKITQDLLWKDVQKGEWSHFRKTIGEYINELSNLSIECETVLLKRILYKHKNQMRRDIPYQFIKKVETLSNRFITMQISVLLKQLHKSTENFDNKKRYSFAQSISVPSAEYFHYIIVKIIGAIRLAQVITEKCKSAARMVYGHLSYGFFVTFNMFAISAMSKLWCLYKEVSVILSKLLQILRDAVNLFYPNITDVISSLIMDGFGNENERTSTESRSSEAKKEAEKKFKEKEKANKSDVAPNPLENEEFDLGETLTADEVRMLRSRYEKQAEGNAMERGNIFQEYPPQQTNISKKPNVSKRSLTTIKCPFCSTLISRGSYLRKPIKTPFTKYFMMKGDKMYWIDILHKLYHSSWGMETKLLLLRYRQMKKRRRRKKFSKSK